MTGFTASFYSGGTGGDKTESGEEIPKKPELKQSTSLLDVEDVPRDLNFPMQPNSPTGDEDEGSEGDETPKLLSDDSVVELSENSQPSKSESQAESMCDVQSITSSQSMTSSQSRGETRDMYSEEAMDELERLGDDDDQSKTTSGAPSSVTDNASSNQDAAASSIITNESHSKSEPNANSNSTNNAATAESVPAGTEADDVQESRDTFVEATPEDISVRRRSWHDAKAEDNKKEEQHVKQEVKLRKAASIDVTRPGSLKKLRAGAESKTSKTSPSPVKATYRPVSMPVDNLVAQMEEEMEGRKTPEETNSGLYH